MCRFEFIDDVLGTFRLHTSSSSADVDLHLQAGLALMDRYCGGVTGAHKGSVGDYPRRLVRRQYANLYHGAARQSHQKGEFRKTWAFYWQAVRLYPIHGRAYAGMGLAAAATLWSWPRARFHRFFHFLKQGSRSNA